jgi:hypothetical protein
MVRLSDLPPAARRKVLAQLGQDPVKRIKVPKGQGRSELELAMAFHMKALGLPNPQPQYEFARPRKWAFDFAWPHLGIALEVDGGAWIEGRHVRGAGFEEDCVKMSEAAVLGWRVLHVEGHMVADGRALALIERALRPAEEKYRL